MPGRTIAIGDIHGCVDALTRLLTEIQPEPEDTIVTLGDYVDRGSDSRAVIECLLSYDKRCGLIPLLGNHEQMLLAARENEEDAAFWLECGGDTTLHSYGGEIDSIPDEHVTFFENCAIAYETTSHIFVHANYEPGSPVNEQDDFTLLWKHLHDVPRPHVSGKKVVVGHTPQVSGEVLDVGHLVCIDTWCFGEGWLTALDVDAGTVWQANKEGILRERSREPEESKE